MSNEIEFRDVNYRTSKTFSIKSLDLNVPKGSLYGFLGPNGSGKSTTIKLLTGMLRPKSGSIRVCGFDVPGDTPRMLQFTGYVPERPHVFPSFRIDEALAFHAAFYPSWDSDWADDMLDKFRLDPKQKIAALSKGETGKLLILMALSQRPQLLVLDEPTDGLDPVARRDVLTAMLDYVSETQATVFISSHLVHELERICDWVGVMDDGCLVAELPMQAFKNGIKRLRVGDAPNIEGETPFVLLNRKPHDGVVPGETWIVRGWQKDMRNYFDTVGATLKDVIDLDLEEGFVELLNSAREETDRV